MFYMKHNNIIANIGQKLAINHLKLLNYTILKQNYRIKHCEIDIIAQKYDLFYLIEVKTVSSKIIKPEEQLSWCKRSSMLKARVLYAFDQNINQDLIFIEFIGVILDFSKKMSASLESFFSNA